MYLVVSNEHGFCVPTSGWMVWYLETQLSSPLISWKFGSRGMYVYICVKFIPEYLNPNPYPSHLTLYKYLYLWSNHYTKNGRWFLFSNWMSKNKDSIHAYMYWIFFFFNFFYAHVLNRISIDQHSTFLFLFFLFIIQNTLAYWTIDAFNNHKVHNLLTQLISIQHFFVFLLFKTSWHTE